MIRPNVTGNISAPTGVATDSNRREEAPLSNAGPTIRPMTSAQLDALAARSASNAAGTRPHDETRGQIDGPHACSMARNNPVTQSDKDALVSGRPMGKEFATEPQGDDRRFRPGDLVYGLGWIENKDAPRGKYARDGGAFKGMRDEPSVIDLYSVLDRELETRSFGKVDRSPRHQDEFVKWVGEHKKYHVILGNKEQENKYKHRELWKRKSKAGLDWVVRREESSLSIHFILDGIDIPSALDKSTSNGQSITASELRWVYRNRSNPQVQDRIQFWQNGEKVAPPWTRQYASARVKEEVGEDLGDYTEEEIERAVSNLLNPWSLYKPKQTTQGDRPGNKVAVSRPEDHAYETARVGIQRPDAQGMNALPVGAAEENNSPAVQATEEGNKYKNTIRSLYRKYGLSNIMPSDSDLNLLSIDELKKCINELEIAHQIDVERKERAEIGDGIRQLLRKYDAFPDDDSLKALPLSELKILHDEIKSFSAESNAGSLIKDTLKVYRVNTYSISKTEADSLARQETQKRKDAISAAQAQQRLGEIIAEEHARMVRKKAEATLADEHLRARRKMEDVLYEKNQAQKLAFNFTSMPGPSKSSHSKSDQSLLSAAIQSDGQRAIGGQDGASHGDTPGPSSSGNSSYIPPAQAPRHAYYDSLFAGHDRETQSRIYRQHALLLHPDKTGNDPVKAEELKQVSAAYTRSLSRL